MTLTRLFISTGDVSGEIHASNVIKTLQEKHPQVDIHGVGGQFMAQTGITLVAKHQQMGTFGLGFITAIPYHMQLGQKILRHLKTWKPQAVLLIDYGMFHLWLAPKIKAMGIKVYYYIPPQIWASRYGRIKKIKRGVDHVFCIFPFEEALYQKENVPVTFVGHPLVSALPPAPNLVEFCKANKLEPDKPIIGLFPGSRKGEVQSLLPAMLDALPLIESQTVTSYQFILAKSPAIPLAILEKHILPFRQKYPQISFAIIENQNHAILALSQAALVASGTVTLEAALYETPVVISYKLSWLAYQIGKRLVRLNHIGLPNILSETYSGFLPELLMSEVTGSNYAKAIEPFLRPSAQQEQAKAAFAQIKAKLGSRVAAEAVVDALMS